MNSDTPRYFLYISGSDGHGSPAGKNLPTRTRTRRNTYPFVRVRDSRAHGRGFEGSRGYENPYMGLGVQNASQMHTRRQLTLVHLLRGYCTYRGVLMTRMILVVVCSYQHKRSTLSAINDDK